MTIQDRFKFVLGPAAISAAGLDDPHDAQNPLNAPEVAVVRRTGIRARWTVEAPRAAVERLARLLADCPAAQQTDDPDCRAEGRAAIRAAAKLRALLES